ASFIQCTRDWRWMTNNGVLLTEKTPTLGCGSGPLRCGKCPEVHKHTVCPSGHVCYSAPPPSINKNGCAEIVCERGVLQISGIPTLGEETALVCNYEREWSVLDAEGMTRIGEEVTANCAVASECANCGLVSQSSACLTQRCEPFLEIVSEHDCKEVICPLGRQLYVEVNGGDLQPVDKLQCTSLTREWISESEDAYGENVKVACGAGPLKCTLCSNLTATELPCPQSHCLSMIEYSVETGCKTATCPRGQSLYLEQEGAEHVLPINSITCESDLGWYVDGRRVGEEPSVVCGDGPHLCAMCHNPHYTKECPANVYCDAQQLDELDSDDECMQFACRSGYQLHVDDQGTWLNSEYLQCTDWDSVIAVGKNFTIENAVVVTCVSECSQCGELPYLSSDCPFTGFCQNRLVRAIDGSCARTTCHEGVMHIRSAGAWKAVGDGLVCNAERKWSYLGEVVENAVCTSCACEVNFYNEEGLDEFCEGWSECLALYPHVAPLSEFSFDIPPDRCSFRHRCPTGYKLLMSLEKANGQHESLVYEDIHPRDYEVAFVCSPTSRFQFVMRSGSQSIAYRIKGVL
ncbi:hypothetical protein PENTCL1PPCAC_25172, partial [Pristionchus entomophagus]